MNDAAPDSYRNVERFSASGDDSAPAEFVAYLDEIAASPGARRSRRRVAELLGIGPGTSVLDVGSGTGFDLVEIAAEVPSHGRLAGVDPSPAMVAEGRRRAALAGAPIEFETALVEALPYPDASFEAVRAIRVLQHVEDAPRAVAEMARVAKRGARVVAVDQDWETLVIDGADRQATRTIAHTMADGLANGWAGRRTRAMFLDAGLDDVAVEATFVELPLEMGRRLAFTSFAEKAVASGALAAAEMERWFAQLADADARGRYFGGFTIFATSGTKR